MKSGLILAGAVVFAVSGCAQASRKVDAVQVSPTAYSNLSCTQIQTEAQDVANRANAASGVQDKNATRDAVATGVAVVLFWPAAFFVRGNNDNAAELAYLKGQLDALEAASEAKDCGIAFRKVET